MTLVDLRGRAAVAGIGELKPTRYANGKTVPHLMLEVAREALERAGVVEEAGDGMEDGQIAEESADHRRLVLVISLVSALFLLGLALSAFILLSNRHRLPPAGS